MTSEALNPRTRQRLASDNLRFLPPEVSRPSYDRSALTVGIVHIGVGGFHRAHMAMTIDTLLNAGGAKDWAICGVGILDSDRRMRDALLGQEGLYSLTLKHADGRRERRVIGSITEYLFASDDVEAVLERMTDPRVRIVSLTITEGGYNIDPVTGGFASENPDVQADLQRPQRPITVFGLVAEALRRRRSREVPAFTVLSCDNIQGNGDVAKRSFTAFAELQDPELAGWMRDTVRFPNSMVDRITPVTTDDDIAETAEALGVDDAWPVVCEPFFQWVIEDSFPAGRPALEDAGTQLVTDVEPYELMKLRLLNASHQAMAYFGYLAGHRLVHEAMTDPHLVSFVRRYMDREATPTLHPVPGVDLDLYKQTLLDRFSNPEVRDTLARLCADSSDRIPKWVVPVIRDQLRTGGELVCAVAIVASWARYAEATDEEGNPIDVVDNRSGELIPLALSQKDEPLAFLANRDVFGDLADSPRVQNAYLSTLDLLHRRGAATVLASFS